MFGRKQLQSANNSVDAPVITETPAETVAVKHAAPVPSQDHLSDARAAVLSEVDPKKAGEMSADELSQHIQELINRLADQNRWLFSHDTLQQLARDILDDMIGIGPVQMLLDDPAVTDIMVNGSEQVYAERQGRLEKTGIRFRDESHLRHLAQRIASMVGRRVDESSPMVDARLADGSRVNIIVPPLALDGTCISIRKFSDHKLSLQDLVHSNSLSREMADFLTIAAKSRLNILVSGGTGAGKTTLLNALSHPIDTHERIVTIEDAAELRLEQTQVIRLETRPASIEGHGEVSQRDLVKNALRMNPRRIILGEVRGAEAFDMLQAMNTGHEGSMSTLHANSSRDAIFRLENMLLMGQANLPVSVMRRQIMSAVDLIVQVERMRDGKRRITEITELVGMEENTPVTRQIFRFELSEDNQSDKHLSGEFRQLAAGSFSFSDKIRYAGLQDRLRHTLQNGEHSA